MAYSGGRAAGAYTRLFDWETPSPLGFTGYDEHSQLYNSSDLTRCFPTAAVSASAAGCYRGLFGTSQPHPASRKPEVEIGRSTTLSVPLYEDRPSGITSYLAPASSTFYHQHHSAVNPPVDQVTLTTFARGRHYQHCGMPSAPMCVAASYPC